MTHSSNTKWVAVFLIPLVLGMLVGCTSSSTNKLLNTVNIISQQLPHALVLAQALATAAGDPQTSTIFIRVSAVVTTDVPLIQAAILAYQANTSSSNFQKVVSVVNALADKVNAEVLAANKITNNQSQLLALASMATLVNGLAIALAVAQGVSAPTSTTAVYQYLDKSEYQKAAKQYGIPYSTIEATVEGN